MKKWFVVLIGMIIGFQSCDIIDNPIKNGGIIQPPDSTKVVRKVVIEDFTGHQCKNCPKAAKQIKDIEALYGDQVIGIAIHAGPSNFTGTNADYPTDFRTPEGTAIYNFFKIPALPMGMVSRVGYPTNTHLKTYPGWPAETANLIDSVAKIEIAQTISYDAASRAVSVAITATALADFSDDLKVCVMLLESGIVSPQLMPDDTRDTTYVHNHVLRDMLTQALGDELGLHPIVRNQILTKQFAGSLDNTWNASNCDIVSFVYNARTYEILQAEISAVAP
jgi:hypothetical protein